MIWFEMLQLKVSMLTDFINIRTCYLTLAQELRVMTKTGYKPEEKIMWKLMKYFFDALKCKCYLEK